VYGDVNGAVGAARAAKKLGIPLAHVEAGLRSFDRAMPEELNRIEIDQLANVLLCSEEAGIKNLADEGLADHAVLVGNTMIDTLIRMLPLIDQEMLPGDVHRPYAVCTLHRPSNVDTVEALTANMEFLREMSERIPVILPVHHRLRLALRDFDLELPAGVIALPPLGYLPFLRLVRDASFIVTDSGGIQEEATYLKKRCFTLRLNTERPSSVVSGSNSLINLAKKDDRDLVLAYADAPVEPHVLVPPLWDGHAGERILAALHASFAR
jgi:UDP-N-acetylglucosamine 2-epimerase (non-hydrolysing)